MAQQFPARLRLVLIPDHQGHVVHVECQGIAKQKQQEHGDKNPHRQAAKIAEHVQEFFAGDRPEPLQVHRSTSCCGASWRSWASMSETNTSSSDGTIGSIRSTRCPSCSKRARTISAAARTVRSDQVQPATEQRHVLDHRQRFQHAQGQLRPRALHLQHVLGHPLGLERLRRARGDQLAAIDQPQAVTVLGLFHVVRGHEDGYALLGHPVDQVPELPAADRIDARGRLVEKHNRRLVQNRTAQRQPLLPAAGQVRGPRAAMVAQAGHLQNPLFASRLLFGRNAIDAAVKIDVLLDRQILVEREFLAHVADVRLDPLGLAANVKTADRAAAAGRRQDAAEHADRRRLAGTVGSQKTKDLSFRHVEADAIDRHEAAETPLQVVDRDRRVLAVIAHDGPPRRPRPGPRQTHPPASARPSESPRPTGRRRPEAARSAGRRRPAGG